MASDTLAQALVAFQKDAPTLQKNAINPHFRSKYLSLDALMEQTLPVLTKHGLAILQFPTTLNGEPALRTRIQHASGEWIEDTMLLVLGKHDPQGQGSAITYARRYAGMAALGLVADTDDDGNAATPARASSAGVRTPTATRQTVTI